MPDIVKNAHGELDWTKVFMGFAMALVVILQQWQAYRIAEIKAQGEANAVQFIKRDEVTKRLDHMDDVFMKKNELLHHLNKLELSHGILNDTE